MHDIPYTLWTVSEKTTRNAFCATFRYVFFKIVCSFLLISPHDRLMTRPTRFGFSVQPEFGKSDLDKQSSEFDFWKSFIQPELRKRDLAKQSSEFAIFWHLIFYNSFFLGGDRIGEDTITYIFTYYTRIPPYILPVPLFVLLVRRVAQKPQRPETFFFETLVGWK